MYEKLPIVLPSSCKIISKSLNKVKIADQETGNKNNLPSFGVPNLKQEEIVLDTGHLKIKFADDDMGFLAFGMQGASGDWEGMPISITAGGEGINIIIDHEQRTMQTLVGDSLCHLTGARHLRVGVAQRRGDELVQELLSDLPGGAYTAVFAVMLVMFLLGFVLDFIEITFVVVPIVGPVLLAMGIDPVWLGIMIAINLQTSFLTPPFGFALFYLRGVAPETIKTMHIYKGVIPFIIIQILAMGMIAYWPQLATWLPTKIV